MEDINLYKKNTHSLNTLNGVLNEDNLQFAKRTMLFDAIREHTELVRTSQKYPNNDISDVDMEVDCVIMSRHRYNKMLKILSNLPEERQDTIKKYLNFPKLEL
jgi:hypothetical protein